ncbi:helix-turn-helix domain-containing protein [Xanthomonas axonopodis]|uniref:helix-turn-helix domain-containing protein n=1 Tax=Xanthomonas axonopodis TaxID=53413 RepID=UPI0014959FFE|nr:AraC family transcriptional regulator [Xanthomonas axonopodis]QKD88410.1 helix-turn-helix transcriptional regulator [Xanthomonas axonopodis pv. vasculorum]
MWSTILLLGSAHGVLGAGLLLLAPVNRIANRCLAALLLVVVALITPYTLGYVGAYDAYPDLTYAPLFWELAIGPLVWLYVRQLARQQLPPRWALHLLPALLQGGYYTWLFTWPLQRKWAWEAAVQVPWIAPLQDAVVLASLAVYLLLAWREYLAYQRWLEHHSSAREELRLPWLRGFLLAASLLVALRLGFTASDRLWHRLSYFDEFPRYLAAALVYYLGLEGWRHARAYDPPWDAPQALEPPTLASAPPVPVPVPVPVPAQPATPEKDWQALGQRVAAQVSAHGWWGEPDLTLPELARRIGTNSNYLSRVLNEGLGLTFSAFVNALRIAEAQRLLAGNADILSIALAVGFGSKASFNRVFRAQVGCTPSDYRRAQRPTS